MRGRLLPLTLSLLVAGLAGCASPTPEAQGTPTPGQDGTPAMGACELAETTLLDWVAPEPPQQEDTTTNFTLPAGSRDLHLAWTEPSAMAGDVLVQLTAPDNSTLLLRGVSSGASAGGTSVTVGGVANNPVVEHTPSPLAGTYVFLARIQGSMPDAALTVTARVCPSA